MLGIYLLPVAVCFQSPTAALTATASPYMFAMQPDLMYAQIPQAFPQEFADTAALLDGTAGVEVMSSPYAL